MRVKELISLEKNLLGQFPGFTVKGQLMILNPVEHTLRGFHFDGSSFDKKSFYVDVFFMPLCVPTEQVHFTFGHRVRDKGGDRWSIQDSNFQLTLELAMQREVLFLSSLHTPKDVAKALEPLTRPNDAGYVNPHCYEALAYTLVQAGEISRAAEVIDTLLKHANPTLAWECEISERARLIQGKLLKHPEAVGEQLAVWEAQTIRNLELDDCKSSIRAS